VGLGRLLGISGIEWSKTGIEEVVVLHGQKKPKPCSKEEIHWRQCNKDWKFTTKLCWDQSSRPCPPAPLGKQKANVVELHHKKKSDTQPKPRDLKKPTPFHLN